MKTTKYFVQKGRKMVLVAKVYPTSKVKGGKKAAEAKAARKENKYKINFDSMLEC